MAKKGKGFFGAVGSFLGSIPAVKKVKKAAKSVKKKIKKAKKKLKKALKKAKKKLKKKLGKVLTKARKLKNNLSKSKLVKRFKKAVKKAVKKAKKYVKKVVKTVKKAAKTAVKAVKKAAKTTVKAVEKAVKTTVKAVKKAVKTTVKAVKTAAKTTVKAVKTAAKTAVKEVKKAAKTTVKVVKKAAVKVGGKVANTYNAFKEGGYKEALSAAVDCIPILGNAKAAYETIVGKDPITGRKLEPWERVVSGASVFGGPAVKIAKRVGGIAVGGKQAGGVVSGIISGGKKGNTTPKPKDKTHKSTVKTDYDKMKDRIQERYKKFAEDKKQNIPQTSDKLLPNELNHGHFGKLPNKRGDDITGHHMPSNKYMQEEFGIDTKESYAMFLEHPHPGKGGRHRRTFTNGLNPKSRKEDYDLYMSLKPRDALAFDINDARRILKEDGLYNKENRAKLKEYIDYYEEYERKNVKIFEKQKE